MRVCIKQESKHQKLLPQAAATWKAAGAGAAVRLHLQHRWGTGTSFKFHYRSSQVKFSAWLQAGAGHNYKRPPALPWLSPEAALGAWRQGCCTCCCFLATTTTSLRDKKVAQANGKYFFSRVISILSFMTHDIWTNAQQHLNTYIEILLQKTEKQQTVVEGMGRNVLWQGTLTCATRTLPHSAGPHSLMVTALETKMLFFFHIENFPLGKVILIMQNIVREKLLSNSNTVQDELHSGKDTDHSYWSPAVRIHISCQT